MKYGIGVVGNTPLLWAEGITADHFITVDSAVKKEIGVTQRTHADSLENNIQEDNSSQPSLKDYAIKHAEVKAGETGDL